MSGCFRAGLLVPLFALGVAGCGTKTGTIAGKVYYKDQLVQAGTVTFQSKLTGVSKSCPIMPDGSYTIERMPPGPVVITVATPATTPAALGGGAAMKMDVSKMGGGDVQKAGGAAPQGLAIPKEYTDPLKSTLTLDVSAGRNSHDIRMK